jgi:hypothetical protein
LHEEGVGGRTVRRDDKEGVPPAEYACLSLTHHHQWGLQGSAPASGIVIHGKPHSVRKPRGILKSLHWGHEPTAIRVMMFHHVDAPGQVVPPRANPLPARRKPISQQEFLRGV